MSGAVVATWYRLPQKRLRDFLSWNDRVFRAFGVRVWIVSDCEIGGLPSHVNVLPYLIEMPMFSLGRTSNYGIRSAIDSGAGVVIKTDVDVMIPPETMQRLLAVPERAAAFPVYRMAQSAAEATARPEMAIRWEGTRGTVAMRSECWRELCGYDERMAGYGPEDGALEDRCLRAGLKLSRLEEGTTAPVYHIAHEEGSPQRRDRRTDHWNRGGINPENREQINELRARADWRDPEWGRPLITTGIARQ